MPYGNLWLPGLSGNYARAENHADLQITGDIDIRCDFKADALAIGALVAKYSTGQLSYMLQTAANGTLSLVVSRADAAGGVTRNSSVVMYEAGKRAHVRVTRTTGTDPDTSAIRFYTSADGGATFTQVSQFVTQPTGLINVGTAPLEIGTRNTGASDAFKGVIYSAQVLDGIDGTVVANPVFQNPRSAWTITATTGADDYRAWEIRGARWEWR